MVYSPALRPAQSQGCQEKAGGAEGYFLAIHAHFLGIGLVRDLPTFGKIQAVSPHLNVAEKEGVAIGWAGPGVFVLPLGSNRFSFAAFDS